MLPYDECPACEQAHLPAGRVTAPRCKSGDQARGQILDFDSEREVGASGPARRSAQECRRPVHWVCRR